MLLKNLKNEAMNKKNHQTPEKQIAGNKKAYHDYFIEERFEAGIALEGWEVKSIRAGRIQLKESYIILKNGEAWIIGAHISPLISASTHIHPDPTRTRKLLLHKKELNRLISAKEREGYTIVPLDLHWGKKRVKLEIAIAKGKKEYDKRDTIKNRDWQREQRRVLKRG
jgi:SsrA-binding protein